MNRIIQLPKTYRIFCLWLLSCLLLFSMQPGSLAKGTAAPANPVERLTIAPSSSVAGETQVEYKVTFYPGKSAKLKKGDKITFFAPPGVLPVNAAGDATIPPGRITVNGTSTTAVSAGGSDTAVTITIPHNPNPTQDIVLIFKGGSSGAGLTNPPIGKQTFAVATTNNATTSATYTFTAASLRSLEVLPQSKIAGQSGVEYRFVLDPGNIGFKKSDVIRIMAAPSVFPATIPAGTVLINGKQVTAEIAHEGNGVIEIPLPENTTPNRPVEILFKGGDDGAGLSNPDAGKQTFSVVTSMHSPKEVTITFEVPPMGPLENVQVQSSSQIAGEMNVEYKVRFNTGSRNGLNAGDYVTFATPAGAVLGKSAPAGSVLVNGVPTTKPSLGNANNYLKVILPVSVKPNQTVEIVFTREAGLRNPGHGKQTFVLMTAKHVKTTATLEFNGQALTRAAMTAGSKRAGEKEVAYTFRFTTSKNGALTGNQYILVYTPPGVYQSQVIPAGKILVNDVPTQKDTVVYKNYVLIYPPVPVGANQEVKVTFLGGADGAGLRNPGWGAKKFLVWTSVDTRVEFSETYQGDVVSNAAMDVSSDTAGKKRVEYQFRFATGEYGELRTGDYLYVYAPKGVLPSGSIKAGAIRVNGVPTTADVRSYDTYVIIPAPANINAGQGVTIQFTKDAELTNPAEGTQKFVVWTVYENKANLSYTFTEGDDSPSQGDDDDTRQNGKLKIEPASKIAGVAYVEYKVTLDLDKQTKLKKGDLITFTAPPGVLPEETIPPGKITVNGTPTNAPATILERGTAARIVVPVNTNHIKELTVIFKGGPTGAGLSNPARGAQTFSLAIYDMVEYSNKLTFSAQTAKSFTVKPATNLAWESDVEYEFSFDPGDVSFKRNDVISLKAHPSVFPSSLAAGSVLVNGIPTRTVVEHDGSGTIEISVPEATPPNKPVTIFFKGGAEGAGLSNPDSGTQSFVLTTSYHADTAAEYKFVTPPLEMVRDLRIIPESDIAGATQVSYKVSFNLGSRFGLKTGEYVILATPKGMIASKSIPAGAITVNGVPTTRPSAGNGSNYVKVILPTSVGANQVLDLGFTAAAGIRNPGHGKQTFTILTPKHLKTSATIEFKGYPLEKLTMESSSLTAGEKEVEYTFRFTTSHNGALAPGQMIIVYTPPGVYQLPVIPAGKILINGVPTNQDLKVYKNYVIIYTPMAIGAGEEVEITFFGGPDGAGLRNPGWGLKKFLVWTTMDTRLEAGATYNGVAAANPSMSVASSIAGERNVEYSFQFTTSERGDLRTGDYLYVYAPSGVFPKGSIPAGTIRVNDVATSTETKTYNTYIILPTPVDIAAGQPVTIRFTPDAGLRNPGGGAQKFLVWTLYDDRATLTQTFTGETLQSLSMEVSEPTAYATHVEYRFRFQTSANGGLDPGSAITVYTPRGVLPTSQIKKGRILVNGVPTEQDTIGNGVNYVMIYTPVAIDGNSDVEVVFLGGEGGAGLTNPAAGKKGFVLWTSYDMKTTVEYTFAKAAAGAIAPKSLRKSVSLPDPEEIGEVDEDDLPQGGEPTDEDEAEDIDLSDKEY